MSRTRLFPRALANLTVLAAALLGGACSDSSGPSEGNPGGDDEAVTGIEIENGFTGDRVFYVYVWPCGTTPSANDLLGSDETIDPGERHLFEMEAGCYEYEIVMESAILIQGERELEEDTIAEIRVLPRDNDGIDGALPLEHRAKLP